ncbi:MULTISPECIES: hypothetical protein [unclassified Bradyrhizobium]|nr:MULTISPECIES: hypothetical protein [unclassified Bradyrhizobium]WOH52708.1 hypothetical protein RX328_11600 [Bradyrhizobium sp. sBnM-33]
MEVDEADKIFVGAIETVANLAAKPRLARLIAALERGLLDKWQ